MAGKRRAGWIAAAAVAFTLLAVVVFVVPFATDEPPAARRAAAPPPVASAPQSRSDTLTEPAPIPEHERGRDRAAEAIPDEEIDIDTDAAMRWATVDLDEVRDALPDNLYWKMSVPTDDPDVLQWRDEERARWNTEYGKVLSGTATEEEINRYFDERRRVSEDAVSFAEYLLLNHGSALPERDVSLLSLASRLHRARLEEMPRRLAEALERKERQDRLREAWLADEKAFLDAQAPADAKQ